MIRQNKLGAFSALLSDTVADALDDLSPSAAALLMTLHFRPEIGVSELARIADVAQPTAVRLLDGLVAKGLVQRKPRVGRHTPLALTSKGWTKAQTLRSARLRSMDRLLAPLSEDEKAGLEDALDKILAAATTSRAFARKTCRLCAHDICNEPDCPLGTRASELERLDGETRKERS
jgi:DNA-binding MarR family transcriptional regulator